MTNRMICPSTMTVLSVALLSLLLVTESHAGSSKKQDNRIPLTDLAEKQAEFDAADRKKAQERAREFNADAMVSVADNLRRAGNYVAALQVYQQARDREPGHLGALIGQAETFLAVGAAEEAERRFRAALDGPGAKGGTKKEDARLRAVAASGVARSLTRQNRAEEALPYFDQVIAAGAADGDFFNYYGVTLDLLERHVDAQLQYGKGLDLKKDDAALTNNLALSFALGENYDTSVRLLSSVVTAHPEASGARKNLAVVYGLSGDMTAAEGLARSNQKADEAEAEIRYIRQIVALPKNLRARAVFLGLDRMPQPVAVQPQAVTAQPIPAQPVLAQPVLPQPVAEVAKAEAVVETVAKPAPVAVPQKTAPTNVALQIGSYPTQADAERGWAKSRKSAGALLADSNESPVYWKMDGVVRVLVPVADGWDGAKAMCERLIAAKVDCLARRMPDIKR